MKNRKRFGLALALLLLAGSAVTAYAEDRVGSNGWRVLFDGEDMDSNFTSSNITEEMSAMQPGDSVSFSVSLENKSDITTDWYMTNEVLRTLEESQTVAEGGAYTYLLEYVDSSNQTTTLYSSDTVGGDEQSGDREGLQEATESLEDYLFLDTLDPGQSGSVNLRVALDGETQGNEYQDTMAQLQLNFAVEQSDTTTTTTTTTTESPSTGTPEKEVIKTGDDHGMLLWSLIALGSGLLILLLAIIKRRKDRRS